MELWAAVVAADAKSGLKRTLLSVILFGFVFGQVEAAVVVYLRTIAQPVRAHLGLPVGEPLPLFDPGQLDGAQRLMYIELGREAGTLIMLAAVAWAAAGRNVRTWVAAFALAFGVWDLAFYFWLWAMIGWPASLYTWDLLFLLPVPWAAPVAAPVIVAASLAIGGAITLVREPEPAPRSAWALLLAGAVVLLIAFMWDWRHWVAGGMPRGFPWALFAAGEVLGIAGFRLGLQGARPRAASAAAAN